ncbi:MAG: AraC family transcriptional regulator [Pseudomonadales bacterium]
MQTETVPTKFARSLLRLADERGYDMQRIAATAGISFDPFDEAGKDYSDHVSALAYSRLYQHLISLVQDTSFMLSAGKKLTPGAFRLLCFCIIGCKDLGHALNRASEFFRVLLDSGMMLSLHVDGEHATIVWGRGHADDTEAQRMLDAYALSIWHRFCGWLIGSPIKLDEVHFVGAQPANARKYTQLFDCPLQFSQPANQFMFGSVALSLPLVQTEQTLKEFLRTAPYQLMVAPIDDDKKLTTQVRSLLGHDFSHGFPDFEQIRNALNMSAPTLRRHLKKEGTNYQKLKDDCRCDAAITYLSRPELSINEVAALMGFSDPSAFHRSFKKWTGLPPGEYRQRELQEQAEASFATTSMS